LFSAFETRDELLAFLKEEFPDETARLDLAGTFNDLLINVATLFERQGQTETLIERALGRRPDNTSLQSLKQKLSTAAGIGAAQDFAVGSDSASVYISGDVRGGEITSSGNVVIGGDVRGTFTHVHRRSVPREELDALPKVMPPFSIEMPQEPVLAPPELVLNWALGMRQAMRAVCLVEASEAMGTGFLVAPDLLLYGGDLGGLSTSNDSHAPRFRFDYCHAPDGSLGRPTVYVPADEWLVASRRNPNYTLIRLEGAPGTDMVPGENVPRGWLSLTAAPVTAGQGLFLLHHGLAGPQMLEYASARQGPAGEIELATLSGEHIGGAGGAPCFNETWQVLAVRIGTDPGRRRLMVVWARDLLVDLERHLPEVQSGETDPAVRLARLRQTLIDSFSFEEVRELARDLRIEWDALSGETRSAKAASLIDHAYASGTLEALVRRCMELRPHARWQ
jgi:hypothetical protein